MELYFNMKTVLWKTFLIARQIYMYISLVMKCQQLQMKLLYSQNSNKNSLLFTKGTCFCSSKRLLTLWVLNVPSTEFLIGCLCKKQTCFRPYQNLGISMGISASASILRTFFLPHKILFRKMELLHPIYLNIFSFG